MIFHLNSSSRSTLVENISEINDRWVESDGVDREAAKDVELNWEHLVCSSDSDRDSHCEVFKLVLWRAFVIVADKISVACVQNRPIWPEFKPDFKLTQPLNVSQSRIELKVWLEILGEEELNLHRVLRPVMQDNSLSIELLVDENIEVVLFLLNKDGNIYALTSHGKWNWLCIVLIFKKDCELLEATSKLIWHECKLNFGL